MNNGADAAGGIIVLLFSCLFFLLPIVLVLGMLALMVYGIVHVATHKMENQAVWVLVVVLGGPIGLIAYFIAKPYRSGA
ncbi:MAG: PLDc N-terminal domain-containing protein [Phycisphaerales bacterium]